MEFSRSSFVDDEMQLNLDGKINSNTADARFLSIMLDDQLKFESHTALEAEWRGPMTS